ncbi:MAG: F0F1 ATP synthase subunit gamma [Gammaproteobacteria bacterium]|nr:F0F1 ATP synthase subunit gamma [Gammaproteobacteria bacterium]MDJ0870201.1 F0F1 ATP synthase subunit gamma [Gammaproteobacteria bacterium]MDJ0890045.1 F0F1 ATP synthase subunit gamma [Gammaproteobacteria bacterium]
MAVGKEIRTKIKSIQSTQKITRAMQMVAASKMRKAQDRMEAARPYAEKMQQVIMHLAHAHSEYRHPFLEDREVKRIGVLVVSTDRGLCGGLNINLFRSVVAEMKEARQQDIEVDLCTFGSKAIGFFKRYGGNIVAEASQLGDSPDVSDIIGPVKVMLDSYSEGTIDAFYLVHNVFINSMTQQPRVVQLLPLKYRGGEAEPEHIEMLKPSEEVELSHYWDYIYEPDSKEVMEHLLMRYMESVVYRGMVENIACEQSARMVAMKAATDNAGSIIEELQLAYNKARQASITQEINEIVGGAAAV